MSINIDDVHAGDVVTLVDDDGTEVHGVVLYHNGYKMIKIAWTHFNLDCFTIVEHKSAEPVWAKARVIKRIRLDSSIVYLCRNRTTGIFSSEYGTEWNIANLQNCVRNGDQIEVVVAE